MIVHEHRVLRTFPLVGAGNLEVLVEVHRLVLVDDDLFVVRLQVEVLLLELEVLVYREVFIHVHVLRFVERGVAGVRRNISLTGNGLVKLRRVGTSYPVWLLEVLNVRSRARTGSLEFLTGLLSHDWLLRGVAAFLFDLLLVVILLLSRAYERRQPDTTG